MPIDHVDTRALAAATGFYGNARDLVTYFSAHLPGDDRLLTDASKRQMQHPLWKTGEEDAPRYGLGLQVTKVGKREVFGHGGGYPGHITRSLVDGERRLAVSVLTNAIDGPAAQLAEAALKLVDLAESKDRGEAAELDPLHRPLREPVGRQRHRAARRPPLRDRPDRRRIPAAEPTTLKPTATRLRVTGGSGYGSYGESYRFTFDADGKVESVRGSSGLPSPTRLDTASPSRLASDRECVAFGHDDPWRASVPAAGVGAQSGPPAPRPAAVAGRPLDHRVRREAGRADGVVDAGRRR